MRKVIGILNKIEEWTLVLVLLSLAILSFVQVLCRYLFGFSFSWMEELGRYVGVFIAFLGASLGVKYGSHFSMDLMYERVKNDRFRHGLKLAVNVVSALIFLVVAWYGWEQTMKLRKFGASMSVIGVPKYWAYLPVPFFSVCISLRFFIASAGSLRGLARNEPYGVKGGKS